MIQKNTYTVETTVENQRKITLTVTDEEGRVLTTQEGSVEDILIPLELVTYKSKFIGHEALETHLDELEKLCFIFKKALDGMSQEFRLRTGYALQDYREKEGAKRDWFAHICGITYNKLRTIETGLIKFTLREAAEIVARWETNKKEDDR